MLQILLFSLFTAGIFAYLFKVPRELRKFPRVSFLGLLKTLFTQRPLHEHNREVLAPALKQRGYAAMFWLGKWSVVVSQPEIVKTLFRNTSQFNKTVQDAHGVFGKFLGLSNILNSNGDEWKRHRKPANPIFHQTFHPELFAPCIEETLEAILDRVNKNPGEAVKVTDLMEFMTLDVLGKGIFSVDFEATKSNGTSRYQYLYSSIMKQIGNPLYFLIPFLNRYPMGSMKVAQKNVVEFNQFIQSLIDQRRKDMKDNKFEDSKDLLSTLLRETENNHEDPLTDEELVHNLNVFFIAGHDTTANTLSCGMYQLAKNKQVQDKLRKEIYDTLQIQPGTNKIVVPTLDQIKDMEYLGLFIKEVMRINPSVAQIIRVLTEDYHIPSDDVVIPKGTKVNVSIYGIHHDPKIYPNPERFDPERFLVGRHDSDVYMPFGGGGRMCIGSNFSLMEQKVYLTMLLQKFTIDIKTTNEDFEQIRVKGMGLTRPSDLKLNFVPRI